MEVEPATALLSAKKRHDLTLLGLCAFGLSGRHRVVRDDVATWNKWADAFGESLKDELSLAWEKGEQSTAIGGHVARLRVTPSQRCVEVDDLRLPPDEAFRLLARPLRVLLENGRNDRTFLLAFADGPTRKKLDEAVENGWLEFETAGGIGELKVRLKEAVSASSELEGAVSASSEQLLRTIYLCDSDAKLPGAPSADAAQVAAALRKLGVRFRAAEGYFGRVLERRAAENYAPPAEVLAWAKAGVQNAHLVFIDANTIEGRRKLAEGVSNRGSPRRRLLASIALGELAKNASDVISVLDMKRGYEDGKRTEATMWQKLDAFQKSALQDGFGESFSSDFYEGQRNLKDASGEIAAFLNTLREQL